MDAWADIVSPASFGGVSFDCLTTRDSLRRALAMHSVPRRNGAVLQDMGGDPRTTSCQLIFFERDKAEEDAEGLNHYQRFLLFVENANSGKSFEFVHPLTGIYLAKVEGLTFDLDGANRNTILAECTFVEDELDKPIFSDSQLNTIALSDVELAAAEFDAELLNAGFDEAQTEAYENLGAESFSVVEKWQADPFIAVRDINLQLQSISARIHNANNALALSSSIEKWLIWRSLTTLHAEIRRAADALRYSRPHIIDFVVRSTSPLMVIMADIYGGKFAEERFDEALRLNYIDNPLSIEAGTTLRLTSPNSENRRGLQGLGA